MSSQEMGEEEALNEAIRQSLLPQYQEQEITVSAATAIPHTRLHVNRTPSVSRNTSRTTVSNSTSNDMSNEEFLFVILFLSALLYYAILLFCQLFVFFLHRSDFLPGVFLFIFCYVPYRCVPNSIRANPSKEEIFFVTLFLSVLSYDFFLLVWELFVFFFSHLELLLVIVFQLCLGWVNVECSNDLIVPPSNTI